MCVQLMSKFLVGQWGLCSSFGWSVMSCYLNDFYGARMSFTKSTGLHPVSEGGLPSHAISLPVILPNKFLWKTLANKIFYLKEFSN